MDRTTRQKMSKETAPVVALQLLSHVQLYGPWTVACQPPLYTWNSPGKLEWVAIFFSRESSQIRDQTHVF